MADIKQASEAIQQGKILAYPTEAVFGLGCDAKNPRALERLRNVKQRASHKGFIVLVSSVDQLARHFPELDIDEVGKEKLLSPQDHPTTWIIQAKQALDPQLSGHNTSLAVRISDHPIVKELCKLAGPIVSSSANIEGQEPAKELMGIKQVFGEQIDFYLDGPLGNATSPSQIIDLNRGEIIRSA